MENVILCNGVYAKSPYSIEEDKIELFSVEELCYYLYKNSFLLQEDFFSEDLFLWIEEECHLKDWSFQLRMMKKNEANMIDYVSFLFERTGFYGNEEIEKVKKVLLGSDHLSLAEKRKIRADAYLKKGRVAVAIREYEALLKDCKGADEKFCARLYHNLGVCNAMLFQYRKAAEEFWRAYRCYPNTESYVQYLSALKLGNSKEEYLAYLSEHKESYEDSLEVERRVSQIKIKWEECKVEKLLLETSEQDHTLFCETILKMTKQAKKDYLYMVKLG